MRIDDLVMSTNESELKKAYFNLESVLCQELKNLFTLEDKISL